MCVCVCGAECFVKEISVASRFYLKNLTEKGETERERDGDSRKRERRETIV